ncbi:NOB1-like protein [Mya arenaria]|uniref:RNA-binding protein NOB1 n=1 Tax=Mya arenaria TaxID=6604 RepID=A0ABY7EU57_MYAAR|nr:NOB1-like protein [Mya arenaria]
MAAVKHVVLDSGAFLRNAPVQDIGETLYTINDVVGEIRDKATKQRLQVLPYTLNFREPSSEAVRAVSEFAKKTGDYRSLSAVDIRVMALTYQLEKEFCGTEHIKTQPEKQVEWKSSSKPLEKARDIAGFYVKQKNVGSSRTVSECSEQTELRSEDVPNIDPTSEHHDDSSEQEKKEVVETDNQDCKNSESEMSDKETVSENIDVDQKADDKCFESQEGDVIPEGDIGEESDSDDDDDDSGVDDDDDDDDGWITPSNIKAVKEKMGGDTVEKAVIQVGCLTTDFAMQNVLIQMGLNVVSVDGMLIKRAKSFVLRITTNVQKLFCPHCGNKTLSKVSMTVNEDGSIRYFLSRRRPQNTRGTKFRLPTPKGGKHTFNPILVEDQQLAHNRVSKKARAKNDVFDPDYVTKASPFIINDVTSRAAKLGITPQSRGGHYWDKRNPNEVRKKGTKKK